MKGFVVSAIAMLVFVQLMVGPAQAITCGQVTSFLAPCIPYLSNGGTPSTACCSGVKSLVGAATTTSDKRAACACVKEAANRLAGLDAAAAAALPTHCGVTMDIPISKNVNCEA